MALSREQVEHIAELAKLQLTDDEIEQFRQQLSDILAHFEQLNELDTSDIPPTATVLPLRNVMRDDEPRRTLTRDEVLANAPDAEDGLFRVKAILD
jgi:aspartyl-tRNA(Asn)/glutamyl-tRNA(Gln) amidotransferase subunit C